MADDATAQPDDDKPISYLPTAGLSYDPTDEVYWQEDALQGELTRTFEVCHGCRMCFKYCDAFPTLFSFIDERHDGDVKRLTGGETAEVLDACFQCKLCEVQCPYTPRDGHEFQLDFPKLVHRRDAVETRKRGGPTLRRRLLGDPDLAGWQARLSLGLVDLLNRFPPNRWLLEKLLGVDRRKLLPPFAGRTFESWARRQEGLVRDEPGGEVVLFQTCYVQHNEPAIGEDVAFVLRHNGLDVRCVRGLVCCGMPAWEHGDLERLRANARANLDLLMPFVEAGAKVAAINPTCSMMLRREYPTLLEGDDRARAERLAEAVRDPGELLWSIRKEDRFQGEVRTKPAGPVAYHAPCHLRTQAVGFKGRDLMRKLFGENPRTVMECSGHDGTWAMTVEGFEPSQRVGEKAFEGMREAESEVWATDCPLAALQLEQHAGRRAHHPFTLLARAYRGEPFPGAADDAQAGEGEATT